MEREKLELLVFDISAPIVHFRKIFSTSTSLSYFFPPRTTVSGLIASMLGLERDSYYELFSPEKCKIAVSIMNPLRKIVQPINYLNLDEISEISLRGLKRKDPRVPTSIEFVVSESLTEWVTYRIFIYHEDLMDELEKRLKERRFAYPLCLGPAYCLANIILDKFPRKKAYIVTSPQNAINISTVTKESQIISFPKGIKVCFESRVPISFSRDRKINLINNYLCQPEGKFIKQIKLKGEVFSYEGFPKGTYGTFME